VRPSPENKPGLCFRSLIGRQHTLGVDHRLGRAGRARREQEFRDGVVIDGREGAGDVRGFRRRRQRRERNRAIEPVRIAGNDNRRVRPGNRIQQDANIFALET
jgi:hypothetical protein